VTTEQKAREAFSEFGSVIFSEYRGIKHHVTFRCGGCGGLSEIRPDDVLRGKQKALCRDCGYAKGLNHYLYVPDKTPLLEMRRALEGRDGFYQRVKGVPQFHLCHIGVDLA